eukprot:scaffold118851_cov54-Cyclotella_meneghiniana.AAC.1
MRILQQPGYDDPNEFPPTRMPSSLSSDRRTMRNSWQKIPQDQMAGNLKDSSLNGILRRQK